MQIKKIVGIDPGLQGAIAIFDTHEHKIDFVGRTPINKKEKIYHYSELVKIFSSLDPETTLCILERQHCMPGEGLPRTFKTGFGFGMFVGMLEALHLPYQIVMAKEWQRRILLNYAKSIPIKERSIQNALHVFKLPFLHRTPRSVVDHDGMADALNMVLYGKYLMESSGGDQHKHILNPVKVCISCGDYVV